MPTFTIKRHPEQTICRHAVWNVYADGRLVCACAYRKGAEALVEELRRLWTETGKEATK